MAGQCGTVAATTLIRPPSQPPAGSKSDDSQCQDNSKEDCNDCGGADDVDLCKTGTDAGCLRCDHRTLAKPRCRSRSTVTSARPRTLIRSPCGVRGDTVGISVSIGTTT